jgi:hypothetical protein
MAKRKLPLAGASGKAPGEQLSERPLNIRQELFCEEYVDNGGNATDAYAKVYGCARSSAEVMGCRLLSKASVQAHVRYLRDQTLRATHIKREDILKALAAQVLIDPLEVIAVVNRPLDKKSYRKLGYKRKALQLVLGPKGVELSMPSAADRRAAANELWEKLGLGQAGSSGNWFDGLGRISERVRGSKKGKQ